MLATLSAPPTPLARAYTPLARAYTPLARACAYAHADSVRAILEATGRENPSVGYDMHYCNTLGTLVLDAGDHGDILSLLITHGVTADYDGMRLYNLLVYAVEIDRPASIDVLIAACLEAHLSESPRWRLLVSHLVARTAKSGNKVCVQKIIDKFNIEPALVLVLVATYHDHGDSVRMLLSIGATVHKVAVMNAIRGLQVPAVRLMLERGADVGVEHINHVFHIDARRHGNVIQPGHDRFGRVYGENAAEILGLLVDNSVGFADTGISGYRVVQSCSPQILSAIFAFNTSPRTRSFLAHFKKARRLRANFVPHTTVTLLGVALRCNRLDNVEILLREDCTITSHEMTFLSSLGHGDDTRPVVNEIFLAQAIASSHHDLEAFVCNSGNP